jgi:hypothetical protein
MHAAPGSRRDERLLPVQFDHQMWCEAAVSDQLVLRRVQPQRVQTENGPIRTRCQFYKD